jgi:hypothetical protein
MDVFAGFKPSDFLSPRNILLRSGDFMNKTVVGIGSGYGTELQLLYPENFTAAQVLNGTQNNINRIFSSTLPQQTTLSPGVTSGGMPPLFQGAPLMVFNQPAGSQTGFQSSLFGISPFFGYPNNFATSATPTLTNSLASQNQALLALSGGFPGLMANNGTGFVAPWNGMGLSNSSTAGLPLWQGVTAASASNTLSGLGLSTSGGQFNAFF